ncbi:MAG: ubiquinone/menaquinone biosynthesis methyltransferase [Bdellovibrionales bacterium]|nr:ubiquinone/menaquinone biosynthesis methyltransferase [Bdellovibrionales bacterium]
MEMEEQKQTVNNMFSSIAKKYDAANSWITFGLDNLWRNKLVRLSSPSKDAHILDCATGTGLLAYAFLKAIGEKGRVDAVDFCADMLKQIKYKDPRFYATQADVMALPFSNQTFDITAIAYGLRNLPDIKKGLEEMARVTKSDGYLMVLETGKPSNPMMLPLIQLYCRWIMPLMGGWITGQYSAYKYLNQTSSNFPSGQILIDIFNSTGCFKDVSCYPLMGGASFIYKAQVHHT